MLELAIAAILIGLNGLFALSELAIVSARGARLRILAQQGKRGAAAALDLSEQPGRFLSTVQIGITLVGILAGAFSGAALSERLDETFEQWGMPTTFAEPIAYVLVIGAITYLSVIIGELVPKHLALKEPERIACLVAPAMRQISRLAAPLVWLLDTSTKLIFTLLGISLARSSTVTDEEIRATIAEAKAAGTIATEEHAMIVGVMRLADRSVRSIMTPRTDVEWIDLAQDEARIRDRLMTTTHARLPVSEHGPDNIIGVVTVRDGMAAALDAAPLDLRPHIHPAPILPDTVGALDALAALRRAPVPMVLVHDEYGHFDGIVTPADILDAIAGAFRADDLPEAEPEAVERTDGSWLLSGSMPADEMAERLLITLPEERDYETVAGLLLSRFQHLPDVSETIDIAGWRFEVVDLDGRRIDKVLASRVGAANGPRPAA